MGKVQQNRRKNSARKIPLADQIVEGKVAKSKNREKIRIRMVEEEVLDSKTSNHILSIAKRQQEGLWENDEKKIKIRQLPLGDEIEDDVNEDAFWDDLKISKIDEEILRSFDNKGGISERQELILQAIANKQADIQTKLSDDGSMKIAEIDPRVKEMYEGIRDVMKKYRSGKVPKAFKIIPKLRNWEQILFITEPHNWSAAAMYQGTRIFSSVLSQNMAQRFYNLVLLPRIRDDLCEYKKLNKHLYNSLCKALFKPAAFMKGIILPLLESGDCTLREAIIFGSIVARNTIPVLHSSACLLKICEMEYAGANSIFIRIFLDKRYALPYRVVDAVIFHFLRFEHQKKQMPVLWHQSLLTFVQRYKTDISSDQKEALFALLRNQSHPKITPEIRRELQASKCRDVEMMDS